MVQNHSNMSLFEKATLGTFDYNSKRSHTNVKKSLGSFAKANVCGGGS
jgi:hypothetical protein